MVALAVVGVRGVFEAAMLWLRWVGVGSECRVVVGGGVCVIG